MAALRKFPQPPPNSRHGLNQRQPSLKSNPTRSGSEALFASLPDR
jgi:hypothetical protein